MSGCVLIDAPFSRFASPAGNGSASLSFTLEGSYSAGFGDARALLDVGRELDLDAGLDDVA